MKQFDNAYLELKNKHKILRIKFIITFVVMTISLVIAGAYIYELKHKIKSYEKFNELSLGYSWETLYNKMVLLDKMSEVN